MNNHDLIILGSGPGGYVAAIRAAQLGMKVAIIEKESLGGVCLNWGCIPTKALLKSAQVFEYLNHAADYGIEISDAKADFEKIIGRSRNVAESMSKGVQFLMKKNNIDVIFGFGKLKPGKRIEVTDNRGNIKEYKANKIIIATGSRAKKMPNMPIDDIRIIDYRKAMTLEKQPSSLIIVGAGAIGLEFAYFYQALGTKVTIIEFMDRLAPIEDIDVSKALEKSFKKMGITVLTNSKVEIAKSHPTNVRVVVSTPKETLNLEADILLSAVGITPNIENIGLEHVGLEIESGKIKVDKFYKTNIEGYYAIGDVVGGQALAHVASA